MGQHKIVFPKYKLPQEDRRDPYKVLQELIRGNERYVKNEPLQRDLKAERESVKKGQDPLAVVIECSDSRVVSVMIFDQGIGDIFRVALAGNVITPEAIGSIIYALEHLKTKVVVNLCHSSCGAANAACEHAKNNTMTNSDVDSILQRLKKIAQESGYDGNTTAKKNSVQSLEELLRVKEIREGVEKGAVLVSAFYNIEDGSVEWLKGCYYDKQIVIEDFEKMLDCLKQRKNV